MCNLIIFEAQLMNFCRDERLVKKSGQEAKIINSKYKILVVEDNPVNSKIVIGMLTNMGYSVVSASDGFQAIDAFKKSAFDLILMDIHMPLCNGLDATKEIRKIEEEKGTHVPIIAVTASVADEFICAQAGMDGKKIRVELMLKYVRFCAKTNFKV